MKIRRLLLALPCLSALLTGCTIVHHQTPPPCQYSTFPCFGYYSTCWRPWPAECPNCPSMAAHVPYEISHPVHPVPHTHLEPPENIDALPLPPRPQQ